MKKIFEALLAVAVLSAIALFLRPVISVSRPRWPPIPDAGKENILSVLNKWKKENIRGDIPKADWPDSIAALKPQAVHFDGHQIDILISGGGIGPGWGYCVTEAGSPPPEGVIVVESPDARFRKFKQID